MHTHIVGERPGHRLTTEIQVGHLEGRSVVARLDSQLLKWAQDLLVAFLARLEEGDNLLVLL